jgi:heme-degrading monooxygenase HmoA
MAQTGPSAYVLINTFAARPGRQQDIAQLIEEFTETVTRHLPGFISATVHRGFDGTHVANYACWQTKAHFTAMFADPRAKAHMSQIEGLADRISPIFYEIVYDLGA